MADNFVVIRRTISQTLVPYKDIQEKLLLQQRSRERQPSSDQRCRPHFGSTAAVDQRGGAHGKADSPKKVTFDERAANVLERSRSEVCLRRRSSYVSRETSLDVSHEEVRERPDEDQNSVKPILRRRSEDEMKSNTTPRRRAKFAARPQSDFFPEFEVKFKNGGLVRERRRAATEPDENERLGRRIALLRKEMLSLRQQDNDLLKQLTALDEHIKDLKELSRVNGGLFGSCVDDGERLNTSGRTVHMNNSPLASPTIKADPQKRGKRGDSGGHTRKQATSGDNGGLRVENGGPGVENGVRRLEETSFEYKEEPLSDPPQQRSPTKITKQSPTRKYSDVFRKTPLRLERKSVSCQFLDPFNEGRVGTRNSQHLQSIGKRVDSTQILPQCNGCSESSGSVIPKRKSQSMSQLQRRTTTRATEASTSDSECSTSGCYGGSSTGSEPELRERQVTRAETSTDEEREKCEADQVFKPGKKKRGYNPASGTKQQELFRKQIVSV